MINLIVGIVKLTGLVLYKAAVILVAVLGFILDKVCEQRGCRK